MFGFRKIENSLLLKFVFVILGVVLIFFVFFLWYIQRTESNLLDSMYRMRKEYIESELNKNITISLNEHLGLIQNRVEEYKKELEYALFTVDKEKAKEVIWDIIMFPGVKKVVLYDLLVNTPFIIATKGKDSKVVFWDKNFPSKRISSDGLSSFQESLYDEGSNRSVGYIRVFYDVSRFTRNAVRLKQEEVVALNREFDFAYHTLHKSLKGKILSLILIFTVLYGILYLFFTKVINRPIRKLERNLKSFFDFLANKSNKVVLDEIETNDEIGRMGKFINEGIKVSMRIHEEQKQHAKEISKLATVIEQSAESIIITNLEGKIEYVNKTFEEITGYSFEEVKGKSPGIVSSGQHTKEFYEEIWNKITTGRNWQGVFTNRRKDGSIYYERAIIFPIKSSDGVIINYAAAKQDITKERMLELQLRHIQKMESIGTLAGGIAHDFNNILTIINGYAELALMSGDSKDSLSENIVPILEATKRGKNLTAQLLAFSRKQVYKPESVDINEVISSMGKMVFRLLGEDVEVEMRLAEELPKIRADVSQLEQVFLNLIVNARDALNEVRVSNFKKKIVIETGEAYIDSESVFSSKYLKAKEGRYVFFSVSDNGIGIDEETKQRIFEPFFTTKGKHRGTGLGLSVVYGIVKQNSGSIDVYSELNKGTKFKIYWPVAEEQELINKRSGSEELLFGKESILVVEDENDVRAFTEKALVSLGYKVYTARDGIAALELLNNNVSVDLIITDLIMPRMNGKEFIEEVRKIYPQVKAIFISGYLDDHISDKDIFENKIVFLSKPYSIKKLSHIVREVLDGEERGL